METTNILIPAGGRFDKRVPISINGATTYIPVGIETEVSASVLEAIENAGITFDTPAGEGGADHGVDLAPPDFEPNEEPPLLGQNIGDTGAEGEQEPGTLDGSIPEIEAEVATIEDPAEIDKLIAAEKAGKSRVGTLRVLEARKEALSA